MLTFHVSCLFLTGLLERPVFSLHVAMEMLSYKLFVTGKAGVGKSSTIAKLTGQPVPTMHNETPGMLETWETLQLYNTVFFFVHVRLL